MCTIKHKYLNPQPSTTGRTLSLSKLSNEGDPTDSETLPYQLDSNNDTMQQTGGRGTPAKGRATDITSTSRKQTEAGSI